MQWNAGGWFGAQLGSTFWLLIAGIAGWAADSRAALGVLGLFLLSNLLGSWLWWSRRLSCYAATQALVFMVGLCSLAAVWLLDSSGAWRSIQSGGYVSPTRTCWIIALVCVGLMLLFHRLGSHSNNA